MVDVRGDVLRPPHCITPAAVKANKIKNEFLQEPVYQQMTLSSVYALQESSFQDISGPIANTDIYKSSFSPRPLGIGMHFQTLLSPLLKVPMLLLSPLLW